MTSCRDCPRLASYRDELKLQFPAYHCQPVEGWGIIQTSQQSSSRDITIRPGIGIVPFVTKSQDPISGLLVSEGDEVASKFAALGLTRTGDREHLDEVGDHWISLLMSRAG